MRLSLFLETDDDEDEMHFIDAFLGQLSFREVRRAISTLHSPFYILQNASMDQSAIVGPTTQIHLYLRASNLPKSLTAQGYRQPDSLARVSVIDPARDPYETAIEYCDATDTGADEEGRIWQTFMDETEVSCVMQ